MREKAVTSFSSAAEAMQGPPGFQTSAAFRNLRWTIAGEQRQEGMRLFCRKLLRRLDEMSMPFYPDVGAMDVKTARHRYVTGVDPWPPSENPFLDGYAIRFAHCIRKQLEPKCWWLFAEIGFDVARLAQIPVMWGGFADEPDMGLWQLYSGHTPNGWSVDNRTYGVKKRAPLTFDC